MGLVDNELIPLNCNQEGSLIAAKYDCVDLDEVRGD